MQVEEEKYLKHFHLFMSHYYTYLYNIFIFFLGGGVLNYSYLVCFKNIRQNFLLIF